MNLRSIGVIASLAGFAVLALVRPGLAFAHAHYDHSTPSIGQVMSAPPAQIDIYTDSDMRKAAGANVIMVTGADGGRVDDGNTVVDDANRQHFSVALQSNLPNGRYVVSFKTLSDVDGDADSGRFAFYVGSGPTAEQKQLDASLNGPPVALTSPAQGGGSQSKLGIVSATAAVAAVLVLIVAGWLLLHGRKGAASVKE